MKKSRIVLVLVVCCLLFSGCWDRRELKDLDVITGSALDINEQQTEVTVEIFSGSGGSGESESQYKIFSAAGATVMDAIEHLNEFGAKSAFWAHDQVLFIGKSAGAYPCSQYLDFFMRDVQIRPTTFLVMVDGSAKEVLSMKMAPGVKSVTQLVAEALKQQQKEGSGCYLAVTLADFTKDLATPGRVPLLPVLSIIEPAADEEAIQQRLKLEKAIFFNHEQMAGILSKQETRGVLWTRQGAKNGIVILDGLQPGEKISLDVVTSDCQVRAKNQDGIPLISLNLQVDCNLNEKTVGAAQNLFMKIPLIEDLLNASIKQDIEAAWRRAVAGKADFMGFGTAIYHFEPDLWQQVGEEWDSAMAFAKLEIKVDSSIISPGATTEAIIQKDKGV